MTDNLLKKFIDDKFRVANIHKFDIAITFSADCPIKRLMYNTSYYINIRCVYLVDLRNTSDLCQEKLIMQFNQKSSQAIKILAVQLPI